MRITLDTNVLLRTVLRDDIEQADAAEAMLARATVLAIPIPVFCEFSWVLRRSYGQTASQIADTIQSVCAIETVATDNLFVAGVDQLEEQHRALPGDGRAADPIDRHQRRMGQNAQTAAQAAPLNHQPGQMTLNPPNQGLRDGIDAKLILVITSSALKNAHWGTENGETA